ncbi:release factor glutamine methyltransferase [Sanguibacter gelidistatuariae]|uniref:peptide chain release factor N(5)-glutamine methyltransferase n=1 Tax=Sanguibacter gelidistatuariae TaxID=1814289 RepID=A0A1G6H4W8_9MICO|nr:putative protein N(5)-glutamine methyltransferase [Sanguibacter gelidistatuariae]SDB89309.1 release factor glutamine methyltransferase [Sanguibacter gelidistatuariae]
MVVNLPPPHSPLTPPDVATRTAVIATLRGAGCVFAEDEALLLIDAAQSPSDLLQAVSRRVAGIPLEHILGWAEFCGLRIAVTPGVFVPRRRTELLAAEAGRLSRAGSVVVDLCCGSGAVAAAIAAIFAGTVADVDLHAADIDPDAVRCARRNVEPGGHVHQGDLYDALPAGLRGRVDVLAVNAPYVPTDAIGLMPPEARTHEPHVALDGGLDGLDIQRRVAASARRWLAPGGHLLIETSAAQAETTRQLVAGAGLVARVVRSEDLDATVVVGQAVVVSGGSSRSREPRAAL